MKKILPAIILVCLLAGCAWIKTRILSNKDETLTVMTYRAESTIDRPIGEVFDYVSDWEHIDSFIPYSEFKIHGDPRIHGPGDYVEGRAVVAGFSIPWRWVVVEFEPGRMMNFGFGRDVRGSMKVELEPAGDRTRAILTAHIFFLPDTVMAGIFEAFVSQDMVFELLDSNMTEVIKRTVAAVEGGSWRDVALDRDPVYKVFVDAYFIAEEVFPMGPEKLFDKFASVEGVNSLMTGSRLEPAGDAPDVFSGVGGRYRLIAGEQREEPLAYDVFVLQNDYPEELRLYFHGYETTMEIDFLVTPTLTLDSKIMVLFIIDLPDTMAGRALDVIIHTSDIDKRVQEALTGVRETVDER